MTKTIVRMLASMSGDDLSVGPGDLVEMPDAEAMRLQAAGFCAIVDPVDIPSDNRILRWCKASGPVAGLDAILDGPGLLLPEDMAAMLDNPGLLIPDGLVADDLATELLAEELATDSQSGQPEDYPIDSIPVDKQSRKRLTDALATIPAEARPNTVAELLEYDQNHGVIKLDHIGESTWKKIEAAISSLGINA